MIIEDTTKTYQGVQVICKEMTHKDELEKYPQKK